MAQNKMVEILGQSLVLTKLARLGFIASLAPENAEDIDIQAYHKDSKKPILIQVKTKGPESKLWQLDVKRFLEIDVIKQPDGTFKHEIHGARKLGQPVFYVFVELVQDTCSTCSQELDELFVCRYRQVSDVVFQEYSKKINKVDATRHKKRGFRQGGGDSTHFSLEKKWVQGWTDWSILKE